MANGQIIIIACINLFLLDFPSDAMKCFQCQHAATPYDCENITECKSDEHCFIQQTVTASGNIVFSSGCISKERCPSVAQTMIGKRSFHITHRRQDLDICFDCCIDDFCNRQGCGLQELPLGQRGPFCFNCTSVQDPASCKSVSLCDQEEMCIVYSEDKPGNMQNFSIRSRCAKLSICNKMSQAGSSSSCATICCNTDFCNDHCGTRQTTSVTTEVSRTTNAPTKMTSEVVTSTTETHLLYTIYTTRKPSHCDTSSGYVHLHSTNAQLCVHMVHRQVSWFDAREACIQEGGRLVVLDTLDKAILLRNELVKNYAHSNYWIGAKFFRDAHNFEWVQDHHHRYVLNATEADWGANEPDYHHDGRKICVGMLAERFRWHAMNCHHSYSYICEH